MLPASSHSHDLDALISDFCREYSLNPLQTDARGCYHLFLDGDDRPISFLRNSWDSAIVFATVTRLNRDPWHCADLIVSLLQRLLVTVKSSEEVLCLDDSASEIILYRPFRPSTLTSKDLFAILEKFADHLYFFRQNASSKSTSAADRTGPATSAVWI